MKNRLFRLGVLALAAVGGISYFLFFSEIFQIKKIAVSGEVGIYEENIKALVYPKNIFLINTGEIEKNILSNFSKIGKVEIYRSLPDALDILITERTPIALWCEQDHCFFADKEGVIFGENPPETDLIKIMGPKEMLNKEKISQILDIQRKLKENPQVTATQALIASEERLNIGTSEGWEIYFNSKGNLDWQVQELALVLEKQITPAKRKNLEYIDLRFSRVFYK